MIRRPLSSVKQGDVTGNYIYDKNGVLMYAPGVELSNSDIDLLKSNHLDGVVVDYTADKDITTKRKIFSSKFERWNRHCIEFPKFISKTMACVKADFFSNIPIGSNSFYAIVYTSALREEIQKCWNRFSQSHNYIAYPLAILKKYHPENYDVSMKATVVTSILALKMNIPSDEFYYLFVASLLSGTGSLIITKKSDEYYNRLIPESLSDYTYYLLSHLDDCSLGVARIIKYSGARYSQIVNHNSMNVKMLLSSQIIKVARYFVLGVRQIDGELDNSSVEAVMKHFYFNSGKDYYLEIIKNITFKRRIFPEGVWVRVLDKISYTNYVGIIVRGNFDQDMKTRPVIELLYDNRDNKLPFPIKIDLAFTTLKTELLPGNYEEKHYEKRA